MNAQCRLLLRRIAPAFLVLSAVYCRTSTASSSATSEPGLPQNAGVEGRPLSASDSAPHQKRPPAPAFESTRPLDGNSEADMQRELLATYLSSLQKLSQMGRVPELDFRDAAKSLRDRLREIDQRSRTRFEDEDLLLPGAQRPFDSRRKSRELPDSTSPDVTSFPIFNALGHDIRTTQNFGKGAVQHEQTHDLFGHHPAEVSSADAERRATSPHQRRTEQQPRRQQTANFQHQANFDAIRTSVANPQSDFIRNKPGFPPRQGSAFSANTRTFQATAAGSFPAAITTTPDRRKFESASTAGNSLFLASLGQPREANSQGFLPLLNLLIPSGIQGHSNPSAAAASSLSTSNRKPGRPASAQPAAGAGAQSPLQLFNLQDSLANLTQGSEDLPGWSDLGVKPQPLIQPFPMQDLVCSKTFCCDTIFDRQATAGCCVVFALQMKVNVPCCSCMGFEVVNEGLFPGVPDLPFLGLG